MILNKIDLKGFRQRQITDKFLEIFDEDGNGEVDFKEFIQGVSQFSVKGDKDTKLRYGVVVNTYFRASISEPKEDNDKAIKLRLVSIIKQRL